MTTTARTVLLGFEVGTGERVEIPIRHMCVTGQTQEAGKTTTLEALITRSRLKALTFVTKPGEGAFGAGRSIPPYFQEQRDNRWKFVSAMLEAHLGERLKFERNWISRASEGTKTLEEVRVRAWELSRTSRGGMNQDQFRMLGVYLDELVPELAAVRWAPTIDLAAGLNVMQLAEFSTSLQQLVIRAALEWVLKRERDVVVVVPEAWQFVPQSRGTPVKLAAVAYIRQGAARHNFLWLDSQDIGGMEKEILRSVPVWILGVQREANEIARTLANIPASARPKAERVATLQLGEFVACWGKHALTTYVQPAGMPEAEARGRALGKRPRTVWRPAVRPGGFESVGAIAERVTAPPPAALPGRNRLIDEVEAFVGRGQAAQRAVDTAIATGKGGDEMNAEQEKKLDRVVGAVERLATALDRARLRDGPPGAGAPAAAPASEVARHDEQAGGQPANSALTAELWAAIKTRALEEAPQILELLIERPELRVRVERNVLEVQGDTLRGRMGRLMLAGFFDGEARTSVHVFEELNRRGWGTAQPNVTKELGELTAMGFFNRDNKWYRLAAGVKITGKTIQAEE